MHGIASDPYIRMLGGKFINHGEQQTATAIVVDPHFPGCGDLGGVCRCHEEWYSLKEYASDLRVVLVLERGHDRRRLRAPIFSARLGAAPR